MRRHTAERDELKALLERAERPCAMSAEQISELVEELGGLSAVLGEATGTERAEVYASLGVRLDYDPHLRRVKATADFVASQDVSEAVSADVHGLRPGLSFLA